MDIADNIIKIEAERLQKQLLNNIGIITHIKYCEAEVRANLQHSN